jgi:hypothetical protein
VFTVRISRSTGVLSGFLVLILGIWAGIIPFIGPYFHYSFGSNETWHYTANRFWLDILPAGTVVAGSLVVLRSGNRLSGVLGSWLAIAGGAWLVVGPALSRIWEHGGVPIGAPMYGHTRQAIELIGYFYGVGVLITALSAFALARFVSRPGLVGREPVGDTMPVADRRAPKPAAFTHPVPVIDDGQRSPGRPVQPVEDDAVAPAATEATVPDTTEVAAPATAPAPTGTLRPTDSTAPVHR